MDLEGGGGRRREEDGSGGMKLRCTFPCKGKLHAGHLDCEKCCGYFRLLAHRWEPGGASISRGKLTLGEIVEGSK